MDLVKEEALTRSTEVVHGPGVHVSNTSTLDSYRSYFALTERTRE